MARPVRVWSARELMLSIPVVSFVLLSLVVVFSAFRSERTAQSGDDSSVVFVACQNKRTDARDINAAIKASPVGAEIVIGGECLIGQTIRLLGDRSYRGQSVGTTLKQRNGANLAAMLASDGYLENTTFTGEPISVRQLTLDGNSGRNRKVATTGIVIRSWLTSVENLNIEDMRGDGIRVTNLSAKGKELTTSQVNGTISGNFITGSGRHGVHVEDTQNAVSDWTLADNWIADSGADGIHLENAAGWMVTGNHVYGVAQNAIYAERLFGTTISDNYVEDFGTTSARGSWYGIYATVQGDAGSTISLNRVFNFALVDGEHNPASQYRYVGIVANYDTAVVSMVGNVLRGAGTDTETGIYATADAPTTMEVASSGNSIVNIPDATFANDQVTVTLGS